MNHVAGVAVSDVPALAELSIRGSGDDAMLAQRNGGLAAAAAPGRPSSCQLLLDPQEEETDQAQVGCCSPGTLSSSPSGGGSGGSSSCPWARLAGVDGCLSEPYCLWFQLLARAYWGELELSGLGGGQRSSSSVSWARLRQASRRNCVRSRANKQKDGRDQSDTSAAPSPGGGEGEEPFSWPGPKTLRLRRTSQGFGFTLRHFIVYPPESAVHSSLKDEDNGSRGRQRLEPMDTIFVKQVKEGGPAHGAGLCTGDRIVKVNGESIIGKTYSQVIALIQNSADSLELCVMPKDEDILQLFSRDITALAYSQDAYIKGNEAYRGNAQNIPEPPPICYPRLEVKAGGLGVAPEACEPPSATLLLRAPSQGSGGTTRRGGDSGCPVPSSSPPHAPAASRTQAEVCVCNDSVTRTLAGATPEPEPPATGEGSQSHSLSHAARAGPSHRTEENRYVPPAPAAPVRPLLTSAPQYDPSPSSSSSRPGGTTYVADTLPPSPAVRATNASSLLSLAPSPPLAAPRSPPTPTPQPCSPLHLQNIDWRNYTTYKDYVDARRPHSYGSRTIAERLDSLRAHAGAGSAYSSQTMATPPPSSTSSPSSQRGPAAASSSSAQARRRSASHDRAGGVTTGTPSRSVSQERLGSGGATSSRNWPRSASQDALPFSSPAQGVSDPRARSCESLGRRTPGPGDDARAAAEHNNRTELEHRLSPAGGGGRGGEGVRGGASQDPLPHRTPLASGRVAEGFSNPPVSSLSSLAFADSKGTTDYSPRTGGLVERPSRLPVKHSLSDTSAASVAAAVPHLLLKDQRAAATTTTTANHLGCYPPSPLQQLQLRLRADSLKLENRQRQQDQELQAGLSSRSASCSGPPQSSAKLHRQTSSPVVVVSSSRTNGQSTTQGVEGAEPTVVMLRRDKGLLPPIRHPSYILAITDPPHHHGEGGGGPEARSLSTPALVSASLTEAGGGGWCPVTVRHASDSTHLGDSLDSIPFIDEPSSPSMELDSSLIPASSLICGTPRITNIPPSPTSPSALFRRQLSHDQDSLRLTITESDSGAKTERSKSYDEGLDNYREERRGRSLMPELKGLKGKAMDRSSEDSGSRGDSSSDVFCDATKEGLLHFKQLSTDKSKRGVGGGMRPWKQMYAVLRGPSLCLYKDRREGQAHANNNLQGGAAAADEPLPISIKACLIDISYSDTKRKNVLRLTTSDCEFLFQAEDREDMLAWIRVIQENSNLDEENADFTSRDLISRKIKEYNTLMSPTGSRTEPSPKASRQSLSIRQTLLGAGKTEPKTPSPQSPRGEERRNMHKDDTSPPKDKTTWRKGISGRMRKPFEKKPSPGVTFGVRLDDCPPAQCNRFVPLIVEVCCKLVEDRGLEYTGIYRVPGNNAAISNMQEELNNKGMNHIDVQDDKWRDLNVISSLLKSFFRKLPEPLFTNDKYADFIEANRIEDPVDRLKVIKRLLHELPDHHYETLKFLSAHLKTVADNSEKNKMEPRNLAIVFGPTLVRTSEDNMTHMVTHMPDQYKIVETLIQNYDWFFTEDGNGEPVTASQEESAVESQPVPNIDHLLTNIGRTASTQGEVSDSPTSDSAKSKGSWGSGKEQFSRELLVSSIFAAASRKRKKSKDKPQPSSSDDDLDAVFPKKELPGQKPNHHQRLLGALPAEAPDQSRFASCPGAEEQAWAAAGKENGRGAELTPKTKKKEHRNSFFLREKAPSRRPSSSSPPPAAPSPGPSGSPGLGYRTAAPPGKSSLSEPPSQPDQNTSDLGTTASSGASAPRSRPRKWMSSGSAAAPDLSAAEADVSSITSDYSTTSSITFLTGAEGSVGALLSPELHGGEEADDERSELVSEGRPMETDSESDFPVFAPAGGSSQSTPGPSLGERGLAPGKSGPAAGGAGAGASEGSASPRMEPRRLLFPSHRPAAERDAPFSRRRSLRQKTDSDSSVEGGLSGGGEGRAESSSSSTRLSRVLDAMRKGRSTGSLSSSSRSESERPSEQQPAAWRLKITERLRFRLRASADDMFGVGGGGGAQKGREARSGGKKKSIRRRHTMGGQRDFAELTAMNDWREQGGADRTAELSAVDRLQPRCSSPDLSIRDWIARERCRGGSGGGGVSVAAGSQFSSVEAVAPKAVPEDDQQPEAPEDTSAAATPAVAPDRPSPSASPGPPQPASPGPPQPAAAGEHVNGGGPQGKNSKAGLAAAADAHPHKLSGAQVVRSRFYQYL